VIKFIYHQNPDEAIRQKSAELAKLKANKSTYPLYKKLLGETLKHDLWYLLRVGLQMNFLDEQLTGHDFIKHLSDNWGSDIGILLPRGFGKTLPVSGMCISCILQDPNIAMLQMSRTDGNADKIGAFVSEHLMYNDMLQECFGRKYNPDGFLPSSVSECGSWGKDGYMLPYRTVRRIDPTFVNISLKSAKAGKHPDIIWVDDATEKENNNEVGYEHVDDVIRGLKYLLPANGFMIWTATRWSDADPVGRAYDKKLRGKQGYFNFLLRSCYVDDDPAKGVTYPRKKRWGMEIETGYTLEALEELRTDPIEGPMFSAQMRNDPAPSDTTEISAADIRIYDPADKPKYISPDSVRMFGIEITGGGRPIYNGFRDFCEELRINIPLVELKSPKEAGMEKADKIIAALQPIVAQGKLHCQEWMIGDVTRQKDTLGYELQRCRVAVHDDIADALSKVTAMAGKLTPSQPNEPAHLYISVDLAYTEKTRSDFTVAIAVAIDHAGNWWVLNYDRFQLERPTELYNRLLKFYRKFEEPVSLRSLSGRKYPGSWR